MQQCQWQRLPKRVIADAKRYDGGIDDRRRLFFVAVSRAAKYAFFSWAPSTDDPRLQLASRFFREVTMSDWVLTPEPQTPVGEKLQAIWHTTVRWPKCMDAAICHLCS